MAKLGIYLRDATMLKEDERAAALHAPTLQTAGVSSFRTCYWPFSLG